MGHLCLTILAHIGTSRAQGYFMLKNRISALLFSYNNHNDLKRLVDLIKPWVEEVVVIDSSGEREFSRNKDW